MAWQATAQEPGTIPPSEPTPVPARGGAAADAWEDRARTRHGRTDREVAPFADEPNWSAGCSRQTGKPDKKATRGV